MLRLSAWRMALPLAAAIAAPAMAQTGVGSATSIERDVSGSLSGRTRPVAVGDSVFANETIRTANASAAQLRFRDNTNIAIGPSAAVVLDRFVYDPNGGARAATINATQGALRWVSGSSNARAYQVRTPHVIIGVRGTSFNLLVERNATTVTLTEGAISVCPIAAPRNCVTLTVPGQTVTANRRRVENVRPNGPTQTEFADRCLRAIDRANCVITASATVAPVIAAPIVDRWSGFYIGVHAGPGRQHGSSITEGSPLVQESIGFGNVARSLNVGGGGGLVGVQAGYNWQVGQIVFGVETDIAYTRFGRRSASATPIPFFSIDVVTAAEQRLNYLGTARGRVGVALGDLMIFGTGGLAYGGVEFAGSIVPEPTGPRAGVNPTYRGSRNETAAGWALGGGFEYALGPNVSVKVDYLHYDLGRRALRLSETTGTAPGEFAAIRAPTRGDVVRAGLNYRF